MTKPAITPAGAAVPDKEPTEKVKLIKPHTHERVPCQVGDTINVTAAEKDFLQRNGVIDTPKAEAAEEK